jgi:hypothetical protein
VLTQPDETGDELLILTDPLTMKKTIVLCFVLFTIAYSCLAQIIVQTTNNTNCSGSNGSASASVGGVISGYNFEWFSGTTPVFSGPVVSNLSPGNYSVKVTDQSNAEIGTAQFVILNEVTMPEVTLQSVPNTSCDSFVPNGQLTVTINNGSASNYEFQWYTGSNANTIIGGAQSATLSQIPSDNYSVSVRNIATGCITFASDYVADAPAFPQVTISNVVINTNCMGSPNGSLTASAGSGNLVFEWYAGTDVFGEVIGSGETFENLGPGTYTVKVTDNNTGCVGLASADLAEDCTITVVEHVNNTSCGMPNGSASVSVGGETEGYVFEWYNSFGLPFHSGPAVTDLEPGNYTVLVKNQSDLSEVGTHVISILDEVIYPEITLMLAANTACDINLANGTLTASVNNGLASDHSFKWYKGIGTAGEVISTTPTLNNVSEGEYTVVVTHLISACETMQVITVEQNSHVPVVTITSTDNTSCVNLPTGELTANTEQPSSNYSFEWYAGPSAEGSILGTTATLTGLEGGTYTLKATELATGCGTILSSEVAVNFTFPEATINVSNNTSCAPANGSLTVSTEGPTVDYNFGWFEGTEFDGVYLGNEATLSNLSSGIYSVVVSGGGAGCYVTLTAEVADECVVTANQKDAELRILYYPNPVTTSLIVRSGVHATVTLIDIKGTILLMQNILPSADAVSLDLSGVKSGKYILRVTKEGKTTSHHVIVEK